MPSSLMSYFFSIINVLFFLKLEGQSAPDIENTTLIRGENKTLILANPHYDIN